MPQIFAILEGSGEVSGTNGVDEPIGAGEAVFLHEGEEHEMKSAAGLTALIIEGESLDRFRGDLIPLASRRSTPETFPNTRAGETLKDSRRIPLL